MKILQKDNISYYQVSPENVEELGVCCIKNRKADGFIKKLEWINCSSNKGVAMILAKDELDKDLGYIEYLPSEIAWRPISAHNYLFVQCIAILSKKVRNKEIASNLIKLTFDIAKDSSRDGVCTMTSNGVWMADRRVFERNDFMVSEEKGRFQLLSKKVNPDAPDPKLRDWDIALSSYKGWHLLYADQCPWHIKSVEDISKLASDIKVDLKVKKIESPQEAQDGPSGYGTFALIKDGKLLSDHYISSSRFNNIVKKEGII